MATYILPEQYLSISEKLNLFKELVMSELMKFRLEELMNAPLDMFVELEGSEFPVLDTR